MKNDCKGYNIDKRVNYNLTKCFCIFNSNVLPPYPLNKVFIMYLNAILTEDKTIEDDE